MDKKPKNILGQAKGKIGQAVDFLSGHKRKERHHDVEEMVMPYEVNTRSDLLGQKTIPYFGVYGKIHSRLIYHLGFEYTWLEPVGIFKKDFTVTQELNMFRKSLPKNVDTLIQNGVEQKLI